MDAMTAPIDADTDAAPAAVQERLYQAAVAAHAPAIARLAHAVERNPDRARDLEQDIHLALWRSLSGFAGRSALSTFVYRVAHNVAASHVARDARGAKGVALEDIADLPAADDPEGTAGTAQLLARIHALIAALRQPDRSVMLLHLEGLDAAAIGAVTGLSANHVAVKLHRIRTMLARHFASGDPR